MTMAEEQKSLLDAPSSLVSVFVQGPLIVTEELHSVSFESELQLNQSGLNIKLEVRPESHTETITRTLQVVQLTACTDRTACPLSFSFFLNV